MLLSQVHAGAQRVLWCSQGGLTVYPFAATAVDPAAHFSHKVHVVGTTTQLMMVSAGTPRHALVDMK